MKFGQPLLTTELTGSMGGATASSARGGVGYFRRRAIPGNPRAPRQTITRFILSSIAAAWAQTLTALQRAGWETISPPESSGIDSYVKVNSQVLIGGSVRIDDPPTSLASTANPITATPVVDESANTVSVAIPAGLANDDSAYNVYASTPQSDSRASRQYGYQYVGTIPTGSSGTSVAVTIPTTHPAFNAEVDDIVYVRVVAFGSGGGGEDGRVGIPQEFRCTVVA